MIRLGNVAATLACSLLLATGFAAPAVAVEPSAPASSEPSAPTPIVAAPTADPSPTSSTEATTTPSAEASASPSSSAEPAPSSTPTTDVAAAAAVSPATPDPIYVFPDNSLCPGDGKLSWVSYASGAITIDLSSLTGRTGITINGSANENCRADITSLSFTNRPNSLTGIHIGEEAFLQARGGVANRLTSVRFPDGITDLQIDPGAFAQQSDVGSNTLSEVVFPDSLERLILKAGAFAQEAAGGTGNNALASVTLRARTGNLTVQTSAFEQSSSGGSNALAHVTFDLLPSNGTGSENLAIGDRAFAQTAQSANALTSISFPAGYPQLQVGDGAFVQISSGGSTSLASVDFGSSLESLSIGMDSFAQQAAAKTSLAHLDFSDSIDQIYIGENAFRQAGDQGTSLASVAFPKSPAIATVDIAAFQQSSQDGNCTLAEITFPETLTVGMELGDSAFFQEAPSGHTALTEIVFPATAPVLSVGSQAFAQTGATNTLRTVIFPHSIGRLEVLWRAFLQEGPLTLERIVFPFSSAPEEGTWFIDGAVAENANVDWQWFGPDGININSWPRVTDSSVGKAKPLVVSSPKVTPQSRAFSQVLAGYRTLDLANLDAGTQTRYVYRDGRSPAAPLSRQTDVVGPANTSGGWTTTLPRPSWKGHTFQGWCSVELQGDAGCSGTLHSAGAHLTLSEPSALWAVWGEADDPEELANTGAENTVPLALLATALIILGTGLILTRRTA
ncbi:LPXTG-motif cell wall-anchored protein [Propionicimonas paludicola]|uniref:LPXTG-motif cell wall-anchored protein n=1 Tax=Propionicimonas paludicola TaxID=185243 RepID=A0A2A9CU29_9ACTN|nr:leucine-rich repeat protein [Propionicimonas paludicola]PFG17626.1 LPXTG-motif cell wall-anchored protein [Propionicimonas paludicola]